MKSVLEMKHEEAKNFFLKGESYSNLDLPPYFNFDEILKNVRRYLDKNELSSLTEGKISDYDDNNYIIFYSKDSKFGWRPIELIHPVLYVDLVNIITDSENWSLITRCFKEFQRHENIICSSLPKESDHQHRDKASQILGWWTDNEQKSIEMGLEYRFLSHTDISNCYDSFYTHSIAWAIHEKDIAKTKAFKRNKSELGNQIDSCIQKMQYGQTNGIPQGSVLMDFIAEIILGYIDTCLISRISAIDDYKIIRYRDDYRIFTKNSRDSESILKSLTECLKPFGLKLNSSKTSIEDDVIISSIKKDKLQWLLNKSDNNSAQKQLLALYHFSLEFPNSGTLLKELTNFYKKSKLEGRVEPLISITSEIAFKNPNTHPVCTAILSKLFEKVESKEKKEEFINKIVTKFKDKPNAEFVDIWIQRICLALDLEIIFSGKLCKLASGEETTLWNSSWIRNNDLRKIVEKPNIINTKQIKKLNEVISLEEFDVFSMCY